MRTNVQAVGEIDRLQSRRLMLPARAQTRGARAVRSGGMRKMMHEQFGGGRPRLGRRRDLSKSAMRIVAGALENCGALRLVVLTGPEFEGRSMGLGRAPSGGA